ncbi:MAG: MMPL family transporter [Rhizobiales bacterium]|nr:MMPL family transporter [Hyphomicrobiales bacterium]
MNPINRSLEFLGHKIIHYPKSVLMLILAFTIFSGFGIARLNFEGAVGNIFNPQSSFVTEFRDLLDNYDNVAREIVIVIEADDILTKTTRNEITDLHLELEFLDDVKSVISIASLRNSPGNPNNIGQIIAEGNFERFSKDEIYKKLYEHPIARHRLISTDSKSTLVIVSLKPMDDRSLSLSTINDKAKKIAKQQLKTSQYYFTGFLAVSAEIVSAILHDQVYFVLGGAILGLIFGYLFFRHVTLVMATAIPSVISIFWTLGVMGWANISVNVMTNIVPTIILVIAFADAMHMVDAMRNRLCLGEKPQDAVMFAIRNVGPACLFTTATTSVAFFSLSFANTPIIAEFGRAAAMGTFLALLAALILSGLICILLSPILPVKATAENAVPNGIVHHKMTAFSVFMASICIKYPKRLIMGGFILLLSTGYIHFLNEPEYRFSENLPDDNPASYAIDIIDKNLGGINSFYYVISRHDAQKLDFEASELVNILKQVDVLIEQQATFKSNSSIVKLIDWLSYNEAAPTIGDLLDNLPIEFTSRFVDKDQKSIITTAFTEDIGAAALRPFLREMRNQANVLIAEHKDYKIILTGLAAMSAEESFEMIDELNNGLLIAMVIIICLMGFVFKSVFYAFASILPNLLPIVAGGALLYFIEGGLQFTTIIALTIAFGIAVDDSIHFLYQYRQYKKKYDAKTAIEKTMKQVGPVLIATTFMLSAGLGLMFLSDLPQMSLFGVIVIFILYVALLADIAILPSIFYIKDRLRK